MMIRMPIEWEGRPVVVRPVSLPDFDPGGPYVRGKYRQMWQLIEAKKDTPFWWSVTETLRWDKKDIAKAVKAMQQAKFRRDIHRELSIIPTQRQGVVFRWNTPFPPKHTFEVKYGR